MSSAKGDEHTIRHAAAHHLSGASAPSAQVGAALRTASEWFEQQLRETIGHLAKTYLEARGVDEDLARRFGLGFAPPGRFALSRALAEFSSEVVSTSGLIIELEDRPPYARFRNRLMVPVRDQQGNVICFTGRVIDGGEPKYLNSPDSAWFDKERILYNLHAAAPVARAQSRLILVEGVFDVIALAGTGIGETVAPLGMAVSADQLETIWSIVDVPLICHDGNAAGRRFARSIALRALPMLTPTRSLAFVNLPDGLDPDDFVRRHGRDAFEKLIDGATPMPDFMASPVFADLHN